jgi:hypothetical protein
MEAQGENPSLNKPQVHILTYLSKYQLRLGSLRMEQTRVAGRRGLTFYLKIKKNADIISVKGINKITQLMPDFEILKYGFKQVFEFVKRYP